MDKIVAGDPLTRSADLIAENVERMRTLFPEAFTEGRVDFEVLKQLLGGSVEDAEEKYGLNWHGKRRARRLALTPSTGTLRPCPEESVDWDSTRNLMIEGDNLEVLKLLQKSYAGKVNLIYIDPPYNTGNDFIYPDKYQDSIRNYMELTGQVDRDNRRLTSNPEVSGRFHTNWLNMMYPRLKIARLLLHDEGAIAISIDEHELPNVLHILSEVFGEENFIAELCVSLNPKGRQLNQFFATSHEYIVIYAKQVDLCALEASSTDAVDESDFPHSDDIGRYRLLPLRNTNKKFNPNTRPNLYYPLYVNEENGNIQHSPVSGEREIYPVFGDGSPAVWRWSRKKVQQEGTHLYGRAVRGRKGDRWDIFQKDYLFKGRRKKIKTIWHSQEVGSTDSAVAELNSLVGMTFDSPKPSELLTALIRLMPSNSLVMDFFAGSGTTGHAVMAQNVIDRGDRRFILVQLPELLDPKNARRKPAADFCDSLGQPRNIAEITKERLRRAAKKIKDENPLFAGDLGFRVFKLDTSNIRAWDPTPDDLDKALLEYINHIKPDRSEQDIFYEILLKLGFDFCKPIETRFIAGKEVRAVGAGAGALIVCLDTTIGHNELEPLTHGIADWHDEIAPANGSTVVFRDSAFANDVAKTNIAAILDQRGIGNVRSL